MVKRILIESTHAEETRVAVVDGSKLVDFDHESDSNKPIKGNLYLATIVRVEPSLQAAFVDFGGNRHGFLSFNEIHPDYFRIPVEDRALLEELRREEFKRQEEVDLIEDGDLDTPEETLVEPQEVEPLDVEGELPDVSDEGIEEIVPEAVEEPEEKKKRPRSVAEFIRRYKIQEVIKSRQVVLVQAVKEERGNKGAAMTTYVSLAGRYCVLMPNAGTTGGISRRITKIADRKRLKKILTSLDVPAGVSLIIRTAGMDRNKTELKRDYKYLLTLWSDIRDQTLKATAPSLIYTEADLINRSIRDMYTPEIDEIWVEGEEAYKTAKGIMRKIMPSHAKRVQKYHDPDCPLFFKHGIEKQINGIFQSQVQLKSGGYLVIHQTEALVSIDVNSGRATKERSVESTAFNTNLEAAREVARQVRLRDLAGLVVIDFIDMQDHRQNQAVERALREAMHDDRARTQIGRISQFGLLELSRQRLRPSLHERSGAQCQRCAGTGFVRTPESLALQLLRIIEEECALNKRKEITVELSSNVGFFLLNQKRQFLTDIEMRYGVKLSLVGNSELDNVFLLKDGAGEVIFASNSMESAASIEAQTGPKERRKSNKERGSSEASSKKQRERKKPGGREPKEAQEAPASKAETKPSAEDKQSTEAAQEGAKKRSRRRQRRGKRPQGTGEKKAEEGSAPASGESEPRPEGSEKTAEKPQRPKKQAPKAASEEPAEEEKSKGSSRKKGWWKRLLDT